MQGMFVLSRYLDVYVPAENAEDSSWGSNWFPNVSCIGSIVSYRGEAPG